MRGHGTEIGYGIVTVVSPPVSTNLTSVADVKLELDIDDTDSDAWLAKAIARSSRAITAYLNRPLAAATYQDMFRLARGIGVEGLRSIVDVLALTVPPVTSLVTVVETRGLVDHVLVEDQDFEVDLALGRVYRLDHHRRQPRPWQAEKVTVQYAGGWVMPSDADDAPVPTLPDDLSDACIRMVVKAYQSRDRDPSVMETSESGVSTRFWVDTKAPDGHFPPDVRELLDAHRALTV